MVVNPASDNGRTARRWPEIARAAAGRGLDLDVRATEAAGHASELTRAALREGAGLIVAVGGDGTVSEVANGFFDGDVPINPEAELAVIPRGSGCDFVKTFGIPKKVDGAARGRRRDGRADDRPRPRPVHGLGRTARRHGSSATSRAPG